MAWPPPVLPTNRTNADPQQDNHPADHNAVNLAVNDLTARVIASANDFMQGYRVTDDGIGLGEWGNLCSGYTPNMGAGWYLILTQYNWRDGNADGETYSYVDARVNGVTVQTQVCAGFSVGSSAITHCMQTIQPHNGGPMELSVRFGFGNSVIYGMAGSNIMAIRLAAF